MRERIEMNVLFKMMWRGPLFAVMWAVALWMGPLGCDSTETDTQVVNEAQGSLSVSAEEQNNCYDECVSGGEEPEACRESCYEASEAGVDACYEGCLARGESEEDCRMWCAEEDRPVDVDEEVLMCIEDCVEGGGGEEECRMECAPAGEDSEENEAYWSCVSDCVMDGGTEDTCVAECREE
jgi:hypothetical protein